MNQFAAEHLQALSERLLVAAGAGADEARLVAAELIETSLLGLDSHGLIRVPQYARQIGEGVIRPKVEPETIKQTGNTLIVDGHNGFGIITARYMTQQVTALAKHGNLAAAASQRTHHVGRLGSYVQQLAREGLFGFAVANSSRQGHYVTPWGATRGRLGTNPLAYGCPTGDEPIVLDMSTSAIAEGAIRAAKQRGDGVPEGFVLDPEGRPTTDPNDFYRDDWGAIRPFGGPQGYKGFGLSLLVELLGSTLAGVAVTPEGETDPYINGFFILAIDPEAFCGRARFVELVDELVDYIRSSPPEAEGVGVVLPGERDWATRKRRAAAGIPVAAGTWREIVDAAAAVGVSEAELERIAHGTAT